MEALPLTAILIRGIGDPGIVWRVIPNHYRAVLQCYPAAFRDEYGNQLDVVQTGRCTRRYLFPLRENSSNPPASRLAAAVAVTAG
jgi:hypothetical protein